MKIERAIGAALVVSLICFLGGCSDKGPPRGEVRGTVKLDGQPVPTGQIVFIPAEGTKGPTSGGAIVNGEYHIAKDKGVVIGSNRVEIRWPKTTGKKIPHPLDPKRMVEERTEAIPAQYNSQSELIRRVEAGSNEGGDFDFDLQSKPK